jgi:hypothetical protein
MLNIENYCFMSSMEFFHVCELFELFYEFYVFISFFFFE